VQVLDDCYEQLPQNRSNSPVQPHCRRAAAVEKFLVGTDHLFKNSFGTSIQGFLDRKNPV